MWDDPLLSFAARSSRSACCTWRFCVLPYLWPSQGRWRLLLFTRTSWPQFLLFPHLPSRTPP